MFHHKPRYFPLASALRHGLKNYTRETLRHDVLAGLVVSLMALPLSMALSIAVGLPPQHGLYTAIVAGIAAALLGGSPMQVSGPTAAFVVIVAPIVAQYGLHGIIWCQIMAGIALIALGTARLGKLVDYVPYAVTTGFTAGIAVTIATLSLNDFMGLRIESLTGHYIEKVFTIAARLPQFNGAELAVGLTTLLVIVFFPKITTKIPAAVAGISLGTLLAWVFTRNGIAVETLHARFSYEMPEGPTGTGIPPYAPSLHLPGDGLFSIPAYDEFITLLVPAMTIAALAALESLLAATVGDRMAHTKHDPNAELNGIGFANILSGLAAGIPATGAIARTAANIHAGAKTPLAAVFHALFILLYVVTMAKYLSYIPMAALAGLLLTVAWRMSHAHQFIEIARKGNRRDTAVMTVCFLLTVFIDMVAGVTSGMLLAGLFHVHDRRNGKRLKLPPEEDLSDN